MQSRMEKYNSNEKRIASRTQKNQSLYEEVRNTTLTDFDVNSNVSIIDEDASSIDVRKVRKFLDEKYNEDAPKRRSIEVPEFDEPAIIEEPLQDTKEYDINAILEKAKKGKNVDYNKERLKKIRDAQYEILNNLDLELKKVEEAKINHVRKEEEDNLVNLINTITELEIKNKNNLSKEASGALDLLSDLKDDDDDVTEPNTVPLESEEKEENKEEIKKDEDSEKGIEEEIIKEEKENKEKEEKDEDKENHIEETLSKLDIDVNKYDDFADVAKKDTGVLVLKVIIFLVVIALVIGAVYILDGVLDLGLFVK